MDTIYKDIGPAKGGRSKRVWLQGQILRKNGWDIQTTYEREFDPQTNTISLIMSQSGKRVVSGKKDSPVIDIVNQNVVELSKLSDKVEISIDNQRITICLHHQDVLREQREQNFKMASEQRNLTMGTFCVGGGMATLGLHEGFAAAGYNVHSDWAVDRSESYLDSAMRNNPAFTTKTKVIAAALEELKRDDLSAVNVAQFSLPCTLHSKARKRAEGLEMAENHPTDTTAIYGLLKQFESINAAVYISENVVEAQNSASYVIIRETLKLLGYNIYQVTLDNQQSGSFEQRPRYWFIAVSKGLAFDTEQSVPTFAKQYQSFGELMDDVPFDDEQWRDHEYLKAKAIRDKEAGKGFKRQLITAQSTSLGVINRLYHKRQSTPPYVTRPEDDKERLLTVAEQARAKSCDPALVKGESFTNATEILGQGVDMNQARGIGLFVARAVCNQNRAVTPILRPVMKPNKQLSLFTAA